MFLIWLKFLRQVLRQRNCSKNPSKSVRTEAVCWVTSALEILILKRNCFKPVIFKSLCHKIKEKKGGDIKHLLERIKYQIVQISKIENR